MIIYGNGATQIKHTETVKASTCNACGSEEYLLHAYRSYFHLFMLLRIYLKTHFYLTCSKCNATLELEAANFEKSGIDKSRFKISKLVFGLTLLPWLLLVVLLSIGVYNDLYAEKSYIVKESVAEIEPGDFLLLHNSEDRDYTIARVIEMKDTVLTAKLSKWAYKKRYDAQDKITKGYEIFDNDFYISEQIKLDTNQLPKYLYIKKIFKRIDDDNDNSNKIHSQDKKDN